MDSNPPPLKLKAGRLLGKGSFATVHKALQNSTVVAVKVLRPEHAGNREAVRMLLREAALASSLSHPHIVRCRAVCQVTLGPHPPSHALVMEYMESGSLADLLLRQMKQPKEQLYSDAEGLMWMLQIADALSYLHRCEPSIIHRDVKPANVLLAPVAASSIKSGGRGHGGSVLGPGPAGKTRLTAKLCDFGLHVAVKPADHRPLFRVASLVARASSSGVFHNARVSEDGSFMLPNRLLRAGERLRGAASAAAVAASAASVPSAGGGGGDVPAAECDSAAGSCETNAFIVPDGLMSMSLMGSALLDIPELPAQSSSLSPVQEVGPGQYCQQLAALPLAVSGGAAAAAGGTDIDGCGGGVAAPNSATLTAAPPYRFLRVCSAGAGTAAAAASAALAAAAASPAAGASPAHRKMLPPRPQPRSNPHAQIDVRTGMQGSAGPEGSTPRPSSPVQRGLGRRLRDIRGVEDEDGATLVRLDTGDGGGGVRTGGLQAVGEDAQAALPTTPQVEDRSSAASAKVSSTGNAASRLNGWLKRQLHLLERESAQRKLLTESPPVPPAVGTGISAATAICASPSGRPSTSRVPFFRTSTAPRESIAATDAADNGVGGGGGGGGGVDGAGGGGGHAGPGLYGARRRSYSFGVSGGLRAAGAASITGTVGAEGSSGAEGAEGGSALTADTPQAAPFLERVFQFSGQCGSSIYMSPEVAQEQPYNEKADVFSFAIMCFEVLSRKLICKTQEGRDGYGFTRMMVAGRRPLVPPSTDPRVAALIQACWNQDPLERPAMQQVVAVLQDVLYGDCGSVGSAAAAATSSCARGVPLRVFNPSPFRTASAILINGSKGDPSSHVRQGSDFSNHAVMGVQRLGVASPGEGASMRTYDNPLSLELSSSLSRSKPQVRLLSTMSSNGTALTTATTNATTAVNATHAGPGGMGTAIDESFLSDTWGRAEARAAADASGGAAPTPTPTPTSSSAIARVMSANRAPLPQSPLRPFPETRQNSIGNASAHVYGSGVGAASESNNGPEEAPQAGLDDTSATHGSVMVSGTQAVRLLDRLAISPCRQGRQAAAAAIAAAAAAVAQRGNAAARQPPLSTSPGNAPLALGGLASAPADASSSAATASSLANEFYGTRNDATGKASSAARADGGASFQERPSNSATSRTCGGGAAAAATTSSLSAATLLPHRPSLEASCSRIRTSSTTTTSAVTGGAQHDAGAWTSAATSSVAVTARDRLSNLTDMKAAEAAATTLVVGCCDELVDGSSSGASREVRSPQARPRGQQPSCCVIC